MTTLHWLSQVNLGERHRIARPAEPAWVLGAEYRLSVDFPEDLRQFYMTSNGIFDIARYEFAIWPLEQLLGTNWTLASEDDWSTTDLVAFGDNGSGNFFCFKRSSPGFLLWSRGNAMSPLLAPDLKTFWSGWISDTSPSR
jgi:hypothetical protein